MQHPHDAVEAGRDYRPHRNRRCPPLEQTGSDPVARARITQQPDSIHGGIISYPVGCLRAALRGVPRCCTRERCRDRGSPHDEFANVTTTEEILAGRARPIGSGPPAVIIEVWQRRLSTR